jgi:hypothetical protein
MQKELHEIEKGKKLLELKVINEKMKIISIFCRWVNIVNNRYIRLVLFLLCLHLDKKVGTPF